MLAFKGAARPSRGLRLVGRESAINTLRQALVCGQDAAQRAGRDYPSLQADIRSMMKIIGIVDTMFARIDMGAIAERHLGTLDGFGERFSVLRKTVPGFKDLAVAAKRIIEQERCDIVIACGMPGGAAIDEACAHEASQGIMTAPAHDEHAHP